MGKKTEREGKGGGEEGGGGMRVGKRTQEKWEKLERIPSSTLLEKVGI